METSYFGFLRSKSGRIMQRRWVSIARYNRFWTGECYSRLYPEAFMLKIEDQEEYTQKYYALVLSKLDPVKVWSDLQDACLLCYEKSDDLRAGKTFCHRRIVAAWLENELGVVVPEIGYTDVILK